MNYFCACPLWMLLKEHMIFCILFEGLCAIRIWYIYMYLVSVSILFLFISFILFCKNVFDNQNSLFLLLIFFTLLSFFLKTVSITLHTDAHTYVYIHTYMHAYMYIHSYVRTYMHAYVHTYMYVGVGLFFTYYFF